MSDKQYFLLCGLPRSGGTLLSSILNQNPDIVVSPLSIVPGLCEKIIDHCDTQSFNNFPTPDTIKKNLVQSTFDNFYKNIESRIVIDKNHAWGNKFYYEMVREYIDENIKVIFVTRPVTEVLSSFILKYDDSFFNVPEEYDDIFFKCKDMLKTGDQIDISLRSLKYLSENYPDKLMVVEYKNLCRRTKRTLENLYEFMGMSYFNHDLNHIPKFTFSGQSYNDTLHEVYPTICESKVNPRKVLGKNYYRFRHYDKFTLPIHTTQ